MSDKTAFPPQINTHTSATDSPACLCCRGALLLLACLALTACGGGGGGGSGAAAAPPPAEPDSGWAQGQFEPAEQFKDLCAAPRAGTDPATGQPYPDLPGAVPDENNWLRSWSHETYLWYAEIIDRDPGLYNDPVDYFDVLTTTATTTSGAPRDQYHFSVPSDEWYDLISSNTAAGYGAHFSILSDIPPREVVVVYTDSGSPATAPGVDLRYNGGGFLDVASQLSYMIAGVNATAGKTFELLQFNDKHPDVNPVTGEPIAPTPFHDTTLGFSLPSDQGLPTLDLTRLFVLTGNNTCSASEAVINGLRGIDFEVILIGGTTCGKPYGSYAQDNCGITYLTIQFQGVNDKGFGDCPVTVATADALMAGKQKPGAIHDGVVPRPAWQKNRIYQGH